MVTLLLDIAKGFFSVWIAAMLTNDDPWWTSAAALAVMAGHAYPVFLRFKGGKAVASFIGAFLYLTPLPLFAVLVVFVAIVIATRHISAGSVIAAGMFPLGVWLILHPPEPVLMAALIAGVFIVVPPSLEHRAPVRGNRERLRLEKTMKLAILGGGSWGTALAIVLAPKFSSITLWLFEADLADRTRASRENDVFLPGFSCLPTST